MRCVFRQNGFAFHLQERKQEKSISLAIAIAKQAYRMEEETEQRERFPELPARF